MTNNKRGRPLSSGKKGSKNKPKVEPFNPSKLQEEFDQVEAAKNFNTDFREKGFGVTPNKGILAVDATKFKPFPHNWFSLSKVDKLQWLTANRK